MRRDGDGSHRQHNGGGRRLIVHADDFGLSEKVNEAILLAHRQGIVTSASLMTVGPAFAQAVEAWRATPTLDLGIHLTLVEEKPLLPAAAIPTLVDSSGRFHRHATGFVKRYFTGRIDAGEVRRELEAQVQKALDSGLAISHVDSHQHLHMLPRIFGIVVEIARRYGIPAVRIPCEAARWRVLARSSFSRVVQLLVLNAFCYKAAKAKSMLRTDHFAGFLFGGDLNKGNLRLLFQSVPPSGSCELMCHPSLDDPQGCHRHWGYRGGAELEALLDADICRLLQKNGFSLISYRDLNKESASRHG